MREREREREREEKVGNSKGVQFRFFSSDPDDVSAHNKRKHKHHSRISIPLPICHFVSIYISLPSPNQSLRNSKKTRWEKKTYIAIPLFHSLNPLPQLLSTPGAIVPSVATPKTALITNRARIIGTTLNTIIVDTSVNATIKTGVSISSRLRGPLDEPMSCEYDALLGDDEHDDLFGLTAMRSRSLRKKVISCSTMGAFSDIQDL